MQTFSRYKIKDRNELPFNPTDYSKFKFGDKSMARKFGNDLASGFISEVLDKCSDDSITRSSDTQFVVVSSPYCFIPTATFAMKDYFVEKLNQYLISNGGNPVQEAKIHRTITYKEDYGALSAKQRIGLIKNDHFHIDKDFVRGKFVLFLDDIKITGSHEVVVRRMINDYELSCNYMFLYYAELDNNKINPNIWNYLNYYFVKSLLHLDKIIKNENFMINTRVVKYILNAPFKEFENFIQYQSIRLVKNIYHLAIGNSYHLIKEYKRNLTYIQTLLKIKPWQ